MAARNYQLLKWMLTFISLVSIFSGTDGERVNACYGDTLHFPCESGSVLVVDSVRYKEVDADQCTTLWPPSKCSPLQSVAALRQRCHGNVRCSLSTDDDALRCSRLPWGDDKRLQIQVTYRCVQEAMVYDICGAHMSLIHSPSGCLESPGFPNPYPMDMTCKVSLMPWSHVHVDLLDYRLSHRYYGGRCPSDSLLLEDGEGGERSWELCGEGKLISFNSTSQTVVVTLKAEGGSADRFNRGFLLCWYALESPSSSPAVSPGAGLGLLPSDTSLPTAHLILPGLPAPAPPSLNTPSSPYPNPSTQTPGDGTHQGKPTYPIHKPASVTPKAGDKGGDTEQVETTPHVLVVPIGGENPDFLPQDRDETGWVTAVSVGVLAVVLGILLVLGFVYIRRQGCEPICHMCGCSRCSQKKETGIHNPNYDDTVLTVSASAPPPASPVVWTSGETSPVYQDPTSVPKAEGKGQGKAKGKGKANPISEPPSKAAQAQEMPEYAVVNKAAKKKKPARLYPNLNTEDIMMMDSDLYHTNA